VSRVALAAPRDRSPSSAPAAPRWGALADLVGALLAGLLRAALASWQIEARGLERLDRLCAGPRPVLAAFWHGSYFGLFPLLEGRAARVFTNDSFRGRVIASLSRRFGYRPVQLPRHSRAAAIAAMREAMREPGLAGIAADGPLGPAHRVKRSVVHVASEVEAWIVPVSVSATRCWRMSRRWDRREIPLPFARVRLLVAPALAVPKEVGRGEIDGWCARVQEAMDALQRDERRAEDESGGPG
jgi:lysophospholipid acyltransferase (LPLAT)-like uncharacterized protein